MAKIGDFAIAKFDNGEYDEKDRPLGYEEIPCLIVGRDSFPPHWQNIVFWKANKSGKLIVYTDSLPKNRLKSVMVTLDDVDGLFDEAAHCEVTQLLENC